MSRSFRSQALQLSPIKEIELAASRVAGVISMAQGIPSFDTPETIKRAVAERMAEGLTAKYSLPLGLRALRERVAVSLADQGMHYDPDSEIIITAGAIEAISATLLALTRPGDEIILPTPSYASYQQVIRLAGCKPVFVPLDEERNFDLDVEAIRKKITPATRAIFYCNPNNPTGTIYSKAQSLAMMELARRHDLFIITDEVYKDFCFTPEPYFTPAMVEGFRERVIRVFSFSKAFAMTGWRVGYLHTGEAVAKEILKVHDSLVTCAPVVSQYAALAALELGDSAVAEFKAAFRRRRDLTLSRLDALSHVFDYQKPNAAYFVFPRVKDTVPLAHDSRALAFDLLHKAGVALVPGVAFGPTGEQHLRFSFGREDREIEEAFHRVEGYFSKAARRAGSRSGGGSGAATGEPVFLAEAPYAPPRRNRLLRRLAVGYLNLAARVFLAHRGPQVIAIAGDQGKTVLKRAITDLLSTAFRARANPRSYNTEIGLPLGVLGMEINPRSVWSIGLTLALAGWRALAGRERLEVLVVELGTRSPGDMARLLATVRPTWAVVTNFSYGGENQPPPAHLLDEVRTLGRVVAPERMLISQDDPLLRLYAKETPGTAIPLALGRMVPLGKAQPGQPAPGWTLQGERALYRMGGDLAGDSAFYAMQGAVALGERLGMAPEDIQAFLTRQTGATEPGAPSTRAKKPAEKKIVKKTGKTTRKK
ncbi:MAG: aminotransferase class I/II-fold pyridoxal phosphate-dependent enzyme [Deltaproteobacteria bacterium]|nr:aminotransferase class I/II-fold pyridoxal phosphate-dependent enzyme [Deltaproteobacteria bacterium]